MTITADNITPEQIRAFGTTVELYSSEHLLVMDALNEHVPRQPAARVHAARAAIAEILNARETERAAKEASARALDNLLEKIANVHLGIETLQTRGRDSLDFYEIGVASLRAALREAFAAGVKAGRNGD